MQLGRVGDFSGSENATTEKGSCSKTGEVPNPSYRFGTLPVPYMGPRGECTSEVTKKLASGVHHAVVLGKQGAFSVITFSDPS